MSKAVLIFGATGKQGGAVLNQLLKRNANFKILAVTRNAKSASAQKLLQKSKNVQLVEGDAQNPGPIFEGASKISGLPIWGVFSVQVIHITPIRLEFFGVLTAAGCCRRTRRVARQSHRRRGLEVRRQGLRIHIG